ncbi:MAG: DUF421 domain-containing protein [Clostridiales bacterium]
MTEFFGSFLDITYRSVFSVIALFFLTKIIGPRQIAQLTFYDYVIGISVGSIAAAIAVEENVSLWLGIWAMAVYIAISYFMAWSGNKSIKARRFFSGTPKILIYKGKILKESLAKQNFDINDLLAACRSGGYFNVEDLEYVFMEINGNLSFLPKSNVAPLTPKDMCINTEPARVLANVILDGKIMDNHLKAIGKDRNWLENQLENQGFKSHKSIFLATANQNGDCHFYPQNETTENRTLFD